MLFNSIDFAVFLPIVFLLYWFLFNKNIKLQNLFLVVASYVFYGWWDWRFLFLIFFSTAVDYFVGRGLLVQQNLTKRKALLWTSMIINLGFLGFFKYYNFFAENFAAAFSFFGREIDAAPLHIILPVGISFYTFQTMSYTIDAYKGKLTPTKDFIAFSAFVSFFPQLVAGPIERATNFLPQFFKTRRFDAAQAVDGLRQMLWGLFKKVVVADNCAEFVDLFFGNPDGYPGSALLLGGILFAIQIYCDFSGYSDIAIGTARLFGFNLMRNFAYPYFSRDIAEFWRRWHISLSTWFRDYLYIPLGGSRGSTAMKIRNTFIIFLVSGFWHGANWTFIIWGAIHALYFLPLLLMKKNRKNLDVVAQGRKWPTLKELASMAAVFLLTVFAWIFFRAESVGEAGRYLSGIFSSSFFTFYDFFGMQKNIVLTLASVVFLFVIEWIGRENQYAIAAIGRQKPRWQRWLFYAFLVFLIGMYMQTNETPFIYFQF